ncbi:DUF6345 domain-containing protein [Actinoplanes sp. NPDC000266]
MTIGIEWVNDYHSASSNLSNNDNNARGFYNRLQGLRRFEYGDDLAWDQDFEESGAGKPAAGTDQLYADNVDIVFFSGHGSRSGASFGVKTFDDGTARASNMRLGNQDLEWLVIDGCEMLAHDNGFVFQRWGWPTLKGAHYILGFHTTAYDVKDRGEKFADRLNQGWTVREAWIRACVETEDDDVSWAYLRADGEGTNTYNDHWHGKGFVSPDPSTPTMLAYARGTC